MNCATFLYNVGRKHLPVATLCTEQWQIFTRKNDLPLPPAQRWSRCWGKGLSLCQLKTATCQMVLQEWNHQLLWSPIFSPPWKDFEVEMHQEWGPTVVTDLHPTLKHFEVEMHQEWGALCLGENWQNRPPDSRIFPGENLTIRILTSSHA